jgi:MFS family permease
MDDVLKGPKSIAWFTLVNALWISLTIQETALMTIAVPSAILTLAPRNHIAALSVLVGCANFGALIVPPIAGWFSDRARQMGGVRRTFVLAGVAIDVCALVALAHAHTLIVFGALFVIAIASANIAIAAYQAMLPEVVPREKWGAASGIRGAATLAGTVLGLSLAGTIPHVASIFYVLAGLLVAGAVSLFFVKEGDAFRPEHATVERWHDFVVVFVARSFIFFGLALLMTFVLYFFRDVMHVGNPSAGTAAVGIFSLLGAVALSVLVGIFSDRLPRKYVVAACGIPMTVAALGFAVAPDQRAIFAFAICFGVGLGGMLSAGWALAIDTLPKLSDVARDLGIWGIATNLPNVIAPLVGGWILSSFAGSRLGYQTIFALAGVCFALGSLCVLRVGSAAAADPAQQTLLPARTRRG